MQVMFDMMHNLMGACPAATCHGLPVRFKTPNALYFRVLHAVVTPPCSTAAERKYSVGEEGEGGGVAGGGRGPGAGEAEMECQERSLWTGSGAKREAARGTHFVHKHSGLPL